MLTQAAERILDDWHGGSRDAYHLMRARLQAESVIEVLRERGWMSIEGVEEARRDIGPLSEASLRRMQGYE